MSFADLPLKAELLHTIAAQGYLNPTPIQERAIPLVVAGGDLLAAARTGTGKTAAFVLPILQRLTDATSSRKVPRVLILVPTRELAAQVAEATRVYGRGLPVRTAEIFGGVNIGPQIAALRRGIDIVVATPGRLLDHIGQRTVDLSGVETLVLDEADRMLDMGFIRDIRRILAVLPKTRQNLLFSATFNPEIRALAEGLLRDPAIVDVAPRNTATELVAQRVHLVEKSRKSALIAHLVTTGDWKQVLVFARTKHGANRLAEQLCEDGLHAGAIHGNKSQSARTRVLADFKAGKVRILVATDIAARGIDIDELPHVVNFDLPHVPEDYVHRIGRTGRAGTPGEAISLVSPDERQQLKQIQRLLGHEIPSSIIEGFAPGSAASAAQPQPRAHRRGGSATSFVKPADSRVPSRGRGRSDRSGNRSANRASNRSGKPASGGHNAHRAR